MTILTLNAGSSSIKYKAYQVNGQQFIPLLSGLIEGIGESEGAWQHHKETREIISHQFNTHEQAFAALADKLKCNLKDHSIQRVGHRVVHGGNLYFQPTLITPEVLEEIRALAEFAPLHNPINALGVQCAQQHYPNALHVAIFDTAFHHNMPPHVRQYAINADLAKHYQIRRYGFHGINHEYVAREAARHLNKPMESCDFISLHLGNGASACLIKAGHSYDTSMGMTPLAGLIMGTRCGDIDPGIILYLEQQENMSASEINNLLNKQSGLKGIAEENDMRKLIARALSDDKTAELAIEMYVYAIQKMIGAYISQAANLDALIFTGGVGENASLIREKVITPLKHLGFEINPDANYSAKNDEKCRDISIYGKPILVIRGDEEILIAQKTSMTFV